MIARRSIWISFSAIAVMFNFASSELKACDDSGNDVPVYNTQKVPLGLGVKFIDFQLYRAENASLVMTLAGIPGLPETFSKYLANEQSAHFVPQNSEYQTGAANLQITHVAGGQWYANGQTYEFRKYTATPLSDRFVWEFWTGCNEPRNTSIIVYYSNFSGN